MIKQKKILDFCPNYNEIINCDFLEDDHLTKKLIEYYQDYIFNINHEDEKQTEVVKKLDAALHRYIEDYRFAKSLKNTLNIDEIIHNNFSYLEQLMEYIINFFCDYQEEEVNVYQTKWI